MTDLSVRNRVATAVAIIITALSLGSTAIAPAVVVTRPVACVGCVVHRPLGP